MAPLSAYICKIPSNNITAAGTSPILDIQCFSEAWANRRQRYPVLNSQYHYDNVTLEITYMLILIIMIMIRLFSLSWFEFARYGENAQSPLWLTRKFPLLLAHNPMEGLELEVLDDFDVWLRQDATRRAARAEERGRVMEGLTMVLNHRLLLGRTSVDEE
ncbi:hypothetical protein MMC15_000101 [Xylographa vitiligo]|nr:hypothetical protein [Xylographa vitiligo]